MKRLTVFFLFVLLLVSCSTKRELPTPTELYAEISDSIEIGEMYDLADEMLEDVIGIAPELYVEAVCMSCGNGISPEEIIIVKATDENSAKTVHEKLEKRLAYIKKSAENYLIEEMPIVEKAFVRQDGLTLSLIVSSRSEEIKEFFNNYS